MADRKQYAHLYNTRAWKLRRKHQLQAAPLCAMCLHLGRVCEASIADHVEPHKGDETAFFQGELQSLCKACHDGPKQREEKRGRAIGCDVSGRPFSRPW